MTLFLFKPRKVSPSQRAAARFASIGASGTRLSLVALLVSLTACSHLQMGAFALSTNPTADDPGSIARGRAAFETNCAGCHGKDADGRGPDAEGLTTAPTDFTAKSYNKAPWRIASRISIGKGSDMPSFKDKLPENTIWDLANYLHSLNQDQAQSPSASHS